MFKLLKPISIDYTNYKWHLYLNILRLIFIFKEKLNDSLHRLCKVLIYRQFYYKIYNIILLLLTG